MTLFDDASSLHKKLSIKLSNKNSTKIFLYRSYYTPVCDQLLLKLSRAKSQSLSLGFYFGEVTFFLMC